MRKREIFGAAALALGLSGDSAVEKKTEETAVLPSLVEMHKEAPKQEVPQGLLEAKKDTKSFPASVAEKESERTTESGFDDTSDMVTDWEVLRSNLDDVKKEIAKVSELSIIEMYSNYNNREEKGFVVGLQDKNGNVKKFANVFANNPQEYQVHLTVSRPAESWPPCEVSSVPPDQAAEILRRMIPVWQEYREKALISERRIEVDTMRADQVTDEHASEQWDGIHGWYQASHKIIQDVLLGK